MFLIGKKKNGHIQRDEDFLICINYYDNYDHTRCNWRNIFVKIKLLIKFKSKLFIVARNIYIYTCNGNKTKDESTIRDVYRECNFPVIYPLVFHFLFFFSFRKTASSR